MLSRVADSLYWMSRYLERAENTVRLLDVTMSLMLDTGGAGAEARWQRMVEALGKPAGMAWNGNLERMAQKLVFDLVDPASVIFCVSAARENARQVREEISTEQWQRLNRLFHQIHSPHAQAQFSSNMNELLASVRGWDSSLPGRWRLHDDPRTGLAVHTARPYAGTRLRNGYTA